MKLEPLTKEKIAVLVWQAGVTDDDLKSAVKWLLQEIEKWIGTADKQIEKLEKKAEKDKSWLTEVNYWYGIRAMSIESYYLIQKAFSGVIDE